MDLPNIFQKEGAESLIQRIESLTPESPHLWGKMSVSQMLAHCCVAYELVYTDKHPRPNLLARFFIKLFAKPVVVGPKPYAKNSRTAPMFIIEGDREFENEKVRLINYIRKTLELGADHFDGKASHAMGNLSKKEWNTLFAKHLDHHLKQFGV